MEAVGVVASIFGISSFALELSKTLYDFGDAVKSASEETHKIARHISNYTSVLDLLKENLENDEPLYTKRALQLADSLSKQSRAVFVEIREIIPGSPPWDGFKWRERTRWAFRKSKVNALVGEIEHLKSTLNLLLQTMMLARQNFLAPNKDQRYTIRAKQALYEQFKASEELSMLRRQEAAEVHSAAPDKGSSTSSSTGVLAAYNDPVLSAFQREYVNSNSSSENRAARLQGESSQWLDRMRAEWSDGNRAESHLFLDVVRKESKSSSGDRNEKNSKPSEQYEEQIRKLRDQLAECYLDRENDKNEFMLMLNEAMEKQQKQSDERYERLKAEHRMYERRNQEDSTVRQSANEERLERLMQELNMKTRVHEQQIQETRMMYEQQIQQMEQEMYRRR